MRQETLRQVIFLKEKYLKLLKGDYNNLEAFLKNILTVKVNQTVLQNTVTILNIYVHTLSFSLPTFFPCSTFKKKKLKKIKITLHRTVMKEKVTKSSLGILSNNRC